VPGGVDIDCTLNEICCNNGCSNVCHESQLVDCKRRARITYNIVNVTQCHPETNVVCKPSQCHIRCQNNIITANLTTPKEVCEPAAEPICKVVQTPVMDKSTKEIQVEEPKCETINEERCFASEEEVCRDVEEEVCEPRQEEEILEPQVKEVCEEENEKVCKTETVRKCKSVFDAEETKITYEQTCEPEWEKSCKFVPSCFDVPICAQRIKIVDGEPQFSMECETERRCSKDGYVKDCTDVIKKSCEPQQKKIHIPKEVCVDVPKETCHWEPKQVCRTVPVPVSNTNHEEHNNSGDQKCETKKVNRCEIVPAWKCVDEPKESCTNELVTKTVPVSTVTYKSEQVCEQPAPPKCTKESDTASRSHKKRTCGLDCDDEICEDVTKDVCEVKTGVRQMVVTVYERCTDVETGEVVSDLPIENKEYYDFSYEEFYDFVTEEGSPGEPLEKSDEKYLADALDILEEIN